jgi:hypothetical protein
LNLGGIGFVDSGRTAARIIATAPGASKFPCQRGPPTRVGVDTFSESIDQPALLGTPERRRVDRADGISVRLDLGPDMDRIAAGRLATWCHASGLPGDRVTKAHCRSGR